MQSEIQSAVLSTRKTQENAANDRKNNRRKKEYTQTTDVSKYTKPVVPIAVHRCINLDGTDKTARGYKLTKKLLGNELEIRGVTVARDANGTPTATLESLKEALKDKCESGIFKKLTDHDDNIPPNAIRDLRRNLDSGSSNIEDLSRLQTGTPVATSDASSNVWYSH